MNATTSQQQTLGSGAIDARPKGQKRAVMDYKLYYERLSARSAGLIDKLLSPHARFKDPFFYDGDKDQRLLLLEILCRSAGALKICVDEVLYSDKDPFKVFFKWSLRLEKDMAELEGMSEIIFDHDNQIIQQNDYWDSASTVWAANPLLRWAFARGKKKLFGDRAH